MSQTAKFEETLRRLAMIDEGFVEDEVGLGIDPAATLALDPKTAALLQVGRRWRSGRRRCAWKEHRPGAGGGREPDEIADTLLAVAPVAGLGRVVTAAPDVATALGYDVAAALENQTTTDGPPVGPAVAREKGTATCAAYEQHVELHQQPDGANGRGR